MAVILFIFLVVGLAHGADEFDGVDAVLNCGKGGVLDDITPMTISAWIFANNEGENSRGSIVSKDEDGTTNYWEFRLFANMRLYFDRAASGGTDVLRETSDFTVAKGSWCHVAVTWIGGTQASGIRMFVNGVEQTYSVNTNSPGTSISDSASNIYIGSRGNVTRTFNGKIEEMAIWNAVLRDDEISKLASARTKWLPVHVSTNSPLRYWPMNETPEGVTLSGAGAVKDKSGNFGNCAASNSPIGRAGILTYP